MRALVVKPGVFFFPWTPFVLLINADLHRGRRGAAGENRGWRRRPSHGRAAVMLSIGSPTRAGGFLFVGVVAPTATSIRVGGHATEHQRLFVKPGSERPLRFTFANPVRFNGRSHQLRGQRPSSAGPQVSIHFSWAPSGTSPVSRYRHNAIKSLRARATIPTLRIRLLPLPKRRRYHWDSALVGW